VLFGIGLCPAFMGRQHIAEPPACALGEAREPRCAGIAILDGAFIVWHRG
jgi:hypothetical protein